MEILVWIGFSQSMFEGILIVTKKQASISDKILSAWLFLLAISFLLSGMEYQIYGQPLLTNAFLLINPAFYLYIRSLTKRDFTLKWFQLLHLVPFIFFQVVIIVFKLTLGGDSINFNTDGLLFSVLFIATTFLSWVVYNILSIVMVHKHRKNLMNEFSSIEANVRIGWLLFIVVFYVTFCLVVLTFGHFNYFSGAELQLTHTVTYSFFLFLVYVLGYYGLKQRKIFSVQSMDLAMKYEKSLLTSDKKSEIKEAIIDLFNRKQPYLDPDLNMDSLSEQIGFPKHQLTEVLSTEINQNFFQFVNSYRVEEVKKHLEDKNNPYSIEAIGYECGFNSKSSFFTIFKKYTGKTPSQYRNSRN
jgi:AraC-like DNA-binding protein